MKVNSSNFDSVIRDTLNQYADQIGESMDEILGKAAKDAAKEIKAGSPGTGKYAKGWKTENTGSRVSPQYTVYNTKPGLPHLLEYGHALRNGGRSRAFPHISPVEAKLADKIEEQIRKALG